jgi:hypothetical protein
MVGGLLEADLDAQCLQDDAQSIAANATSRRVILDGPSVPRFARVGPLAKDVHEARRVIAQYAHAHPDVPQGNLGLAPAKPTAPKSDGASSTSSPVSSSTTKKKPLEDDPLPRAMALYPFLMHDPAMGPVGLTPRFVRLPDPFAPSVASITAQGGENGAGWQGHTSSWRAGNGTSMTTSSYEGFGSASSPSVSSSSVHSGSSSASSSTHASSHTSSSSHSSHSSSSSSHTHR